MECYKYLMQKKAGKLKLEKEKQMGQLKNKYEGDRHELNRIRQARPNYTLPHTLNPGAQRGREKQR